MPECLNGSYGRTDLPFPLPPLWKGKVDKGYFEEGGKESLQLQWDAGNNAAPPSSMPSGVDMHAAAANGTVDDAGDARIQVFLKNGPSNRAPAFVVRNISINDTAGRARPRLFGGGRGRVRVGGGAAPAPADVVKTAHEQQPKKVKITKLLHHGKELDMAKTLKEQGVFREPSLLSFE